MKPHKTYSHSKARRLAHAILRGHDDAPRSPTKAEIKFGYGCTHYMTIDKRSLAMTPLELAKRYNLARASGYKLYRLVHPQTK